jgi:CRP-like cAMP-binding protein
MLVAQRTVPAGTDIIHDGEEGGPFYTLWAGWAYRYKSLRAGAGDRGRRQQILDLLLPGDLIGLESALTGQACHAVRALTEVVVCLHNPKAFLRLFDACPRLAHAVVETVIRDDRRADMRLAVVGQRNATQRLAHFLLDLSDRLSQRDLVEAEGQSLPFPLQRRHLADALGMSGTHVARALAELRAAALVEVAEGHLVLRDRAALAALCGYRAFDGMGRRAIL